MGKIHPSPRIVYVLFTKADFANKKCAFQRMKEEARMMLLRTPLRSIVFI